MIYYTYFSLSYTYVSVCTQFVFFYFKGVITLESLGKRGYRVPPSGTIQVVCVL